MRVGSLFTGIGGLDLGLSRAGFEIAWQVEIDPFCLKLLCQRWPEVPKHRDIRECGAHNLAAVDLIVGGFPCQDISTAGKQRGIEGERSGLWREQARIIAELKPRYVLIENVAALLYATKRWDGTRREAAITTVLRDLAERGYDAQWRVCSAAEFGAPHLRKRVFLVAYLPCQRSGTRWTEPARQPGQTNADSSSTAEVADATGRGQQERGCTTGLHTEFDASGPEVADANSARLRLRENQQEPRTRRAGAANVGEDGERGYVADACGQGLEKRDRCAEAQTQSWAAIDECRGYQGQAESCLGGGAHGISRELDKTFLSISAIFEEFPPQVAAIHHLWPARPGQEQFEWEPPRVITGKLPNRVARLKGLGNAALPQIAEAIGRGIKRHAAAQQGREASEC